MPKPIRWLKEGTVRVEYLDIEALGADTDLPFQLNRYFDSPPGTATVALGRLILTRARPQGIANAARLMRSAFSGQHPLRPPIIIRSYGTSDFLVEDGNSTVINAVASNWPEILCLRDDAQA